MLKATILSMLLLASNFNLPRYSMSSNTINKKITPSIIAYGIALAFALWIIYTNTTNANQSLNNQTLPPDRNHPSQDNSNETPIDYAHKANNQETINLLTNTTTKNASSPTIDLDNHPLILSIAKNDRAGVEKYLSENTNDNEITNVILFGGLYFAVSFQNIELTKLILPHIANIQNIIIPVNQQPTNLMSLVLTSMLCLQNKELTSLLLSTNIDIHTTIPPYGLTLLDYALITKNINWIQFILDSGFYIDTIYQTKDFSENTALFTAIRLQDIQIIKYLINSGANVNVQLDDDSYLHLLCNDNAYDTDLEIVKILIESGADINARSWDEETPLHRAAAYCNNPQIIQLLLDYGADINAINDEGQTPLHRAINLSDNPTVIDTLIAAGADVNIADHYGYTPLMYIQHLESI